MKYLIVQEWNSTKGNHAGMVHMCRLLKEKFPNDYEVIVLPIPNYKSSKSIVGILYNKLYSSFVLSREQKKCCEEMFKSLKDGDSVFLLEYLLKSVSQFELACHIKKHFPNVRINALSHFTSSMMIKSGIDDVMIAKWVKPVDKMMTLGSSLSKYFIDNGVPEEKVSTGFHYADLAFYENKSDLTPSDSVTCISMGGLQRNYELLAALVKATPTIRWNICRGHQKVDHLFVGCENATLYGFLDETELRDLMHHSDISVNVMDDTVGSNVITTSLASGEALAVSDVGSIRDYCDETNAVFCKNEVKSFADAIVKLASDKNRLRNMKEHARKKSHDLDIVNVNDWFNAL